MERVTGIEPAWPAWKAGALPLSYTRELQPKSQRLYSTPSQMVLDFYLYFLQESARFVFADLPDTSNVTLGLAKWRF